MKWILFLYLTITSFAASVRVKRSNFSGAHKLRTSIHGFKDDTENPPDTLQDDISRETYSKISRNVEPQEDTPGSAGSYPHTKMRPIYGNSDNLGITYGKTNQRIVYSISRKYNELKKLLRQLKQTHNAQERRSQYAKTNQKIKFRMSRRNNVLEKLLRLLAPTTKTREQRNQPSIIAYLEKQRDSSSDEFEEAQLFSNSWTRRNGRYDTDAHFSESESSSEYETNPQNPYTAQKGKYLQNYLWNLAMSGDHMNINPHAPKFHAIGPFGPELIFARKWWYFNQDDYVPFG